MGVCREGLRSLPITLEKTECRKTNARVGVIDMIQKKKVQTDFLADPQENTTHTEVARTASVQLDILAAADLDSNLVEEDGHLLFRFIESEDLDAEMDQERNQRLKCLG
jgi:hypothetical protein